MWCGTSGLHVDIKGFVLGTVTLPILSHAGLELLLGA